MTKYVHEENLLQKIADKLIVSHKAYDVKLIRDVAVHEYSRFESLIEMYIKWKPENEWLLLVRADAASFESEIKISEIVETL